MDAARTVCETEDVDDLLEKLADKSLVRFTSVGVDGALRCQMIQAVREYALDRLSGSGETAQIQRRYAEYYLNMVLEAEPHTGASDQVYWMRRIEQERENLQNALQWMLNQKETEMAFTLLGAVWRYYNMLNIWDETETWMDRALTQGTQLESTARMKTLWGAYWLASRQNDRPKSWALAEEGLRLARKLEDRRLIGLLLQCMSNELGHHNR